MRTSQGKVFLSLKNVQAFLGANAAALGAVVTSGAAKRLDDIVTKLEAHVQSQGNAEAAAKETTQKHYLLRRALLLEHMTPIARIAAAELPASPELLPLRMPKGDPSAVRLHTLAQGMAGVADRHADVFKAAGLPDDFVAQLTAAADAMLASVDERRQTVTVGSYATGGIRILLTAGRKVVHVLDAMVKISIKGNATLLQNWDRAKRVYLLTGGPPAGTPPAPAPTPTGPAPAAA